ncbi:glycosyltransferase [Aliivibrio fischeri]|uniref:glycosyltransferase n=1 Tax=Aliivibrio fischeri TaxID=668 RepID=UPI0012D8D8FE|nr:glycosyltransferase [Aliivibrio fischeri]MUK29474.1 glycosyltransferase [Aliivibrio fischeri]
MYDYIIVTHLPAFYKVNLYNELAKNIKIFVIFVSSETNEKRSSDFSSLKDASFEYFLLTQQALQQRNKLKTLYKLFLKIHNIQYKKILVSGWDLPEFWLVAILSPSKKNCLALESTIVESNISGLKGNIKRLFLSMIETVFASGKLHVDLLGKLDYKKEIRVTKGVGIINKPYFERIEKEYQKRFLFIGRLSKVKNLELLINVFNKLPNHKLTIVGDGEEKQYLASIANSNIKFIGSIENTELKYIFNNNDIFILPSISETWGLVIEEALYFGLPVIVSRNCGACELIDNEFNGYVVEPSLNNLEFIIKNISNDTYNKFCNNVRLYPIENKDRHQVLIYECVNALM